MRRSRVNPVSQKRRKRMATYAEARAEVLERSGGRCEARHIVLEGVDCSGWCEHIHHVRLRSQGGSDDASNLKALCQQHHHWAHANPKAAGELGLIELTHAPDPLSLAVTRVERKL